MRHVIWDWNGTLLNDLDLLAEATSASLQAIGGPPIGAVEYRQHHARPFTRLYEAFVKRTVTDDELELIAERFHETYYSMVHRAELAIDAITALDRVQEDGATQSILSMSFHDELVALVDKLGVTSYFTRIDGDVRVTSGLKTDLLMRHLERLAGELGGTFDAANTVLIGDTEDDGEAARNAGISCVLTDTGAQLAEHLERVGWPVAGSLTHAVELAGFRR